MADLKLEKARNRKHQDLFEMLQLLNLIINALYT